ncbi:MAG: LysR family transcriptional regulator [Clostridia bacterium]|nr:LysR family transcriptional regulator [Clostridia bacterium]
MESRKLEILMIAADLGSLSRASEVVGYTQSGLSHMMDALEKEVGFALLKRGPGGIRLTEQGAQLMPAIREFLQANANLEQRIREIAESEPSVIRVAAYSSISMHWMPEILYRFRRLCPQLHVDLRMVDHALEPFELLESGQTDVIFASRQQYACCDWTPLYHERMYAILPRDYPLREEGGFPLKEFEGLEFIMPWGRFDKEVHAAMAPVGVQLNARSPRVDDETVIRMVGRGLGVSMMSELMIRGRTDDVLCVPVQPPAIRELGMGTHVRQRETEGIRRLKECVMQFVETLPSAQAAASSQICEASPL